MKLQARLYTRDGKKYFQTAATKGTEVIPFIYRGDIIFPGIGSDDPRHEELFTKVQETLNKKHSIYYPNSRRQSSSGTMVHHYIEEILKEMGYEQDEILKQGKDLFIEDPIILNWTQVTMLNNHETVYQFAEHEKAEV